jgi:hypothetical protein
MQKLHKVPVSCVFVVKMRFFFKSSQKLRFEVKNAVKI